MWRDVKRVQEQLSWSGEGKGGGAGAQRCAESSVPSHIAEELGETLAGGLWTCSPREDEGMAGVGVGLRLLPVENGQQGRGWEGSFAFLVLWSRVN